jgi:3-oxoacyl-[acyl-carrier protein] reductase
LDPDFVDGLGVSFFYGGCANPTVIERTNARERTLMDLRLDKSVVIVTGASKGIGFALAKSFANEGARLAICARNKDDLDRAAHDIRKAGAECLAVAANLAEPQACAHFVSAAAAHFGRLDVLVNNASANVDNRLGPIDQVSFGDILARVHGKTLPAIGCSQAALEPMRRSGGGRIVMIGGTAARAVLRRDERPAPEAGSGFPQGMGNAALANFAKYLSEEAAVDGILVNVVHPHITRTDRHPDRIASRARHLGVSEAEAEADLVKGIPIGRVIEVSDIVPLVLFLASPLAGAITGQAIAVDGGALRDVRY